LSVIAIFKSAVQQCKPLVPPLNSKVNELQTFSENSFNVEPLLTLFSPKMNQLGYFVIQFTRNVCVLSETALTLIRT
jgi:hypothetical protein